MFGAGAAPAETRALGSTPPAATGGLWRVSRGSDSAVLKVVRPGAGGSPRWPAASEPAHPYYWRREPLAYQSGLLEPFGAPRLRACVERADGSVALWLEDVPAPPPWTPEQLGAVARRVGRAQGAFAADPPAHDWLARDFLRVYLELHSAADPDGVLDRLASLPRTVVHNDLHPANVLGADASVLVDWAYVGLGALGLDPGVLVADGLADEAFPAPLADDCADEVWRGYLAGLREAGWAGDEDDVRFAFRRGTALRLSWLLPDRPAWVAARELLARWRELG